MPADIEQIIADLEKYKQDKDVVLTVQIAPAVRVAVGEYFGLPAGTNVITKLIPALRALGFKYIFDTNFGADLTIVEEAAELVERLKNNDRLPMFTTCCPTWYQFVERLYPELIPYLSTVKSPQAMLASVVKSYFAEKSGIDYHKIKHYVIAPCVVKKQEAQKKDLWIYENENIPNIDQVITSKELAEILKKKGIDLAENSGTGNGSEKPDKQKNSSFDNPLGESSGAGAIFGTTGGVMEAALRTAYFYITGKELSKYELDAVRNTSAKKENVVKIGDYKIRIATFNSLGEVRNVLEELKETGKSKYDFVEVMACPMGCIGGAGQSTPDKEILMKRRQALFDYDKVHKSRASHANPHIIKLYNDFFGGVHSAKAKKLLHTKYIDRRGDPAEDFVCHI